jgi:hypothetical protein
MALLPSASMNEVTHVAFADETGYNTGQFRGVAEISLAVVDEPATTSTIHRLLDESNVTELKWSKVTSARDRFAAEKVLDEVITLAARKTVRADVLMWDITDSRHAVVGRDDVANLGRMYHHFFVDLLRTRRPDEARWMVHPDENSIDWSAVEGFLRGKALVGRPIEGELFRRLRKAFRLEGVVPVDSADHPLVQVADLLAGLAAFSRSDYEGFTTWETERYGQEQLFPSDTAAQRSRSDLVRYEALRRFNSKCKEVKLGVSFASRKCLWTRSRRTRSTSGGGSPRPLRIEHPARSASGLTQVEESGRLHEFSPISPRAPNWTEVEKIPAGRWAFAPLERPSREGSARRVPEEE